MEDFAREQRLQTDEWGRPLYLDPWSGSKPARDEDDEDDPAADDDGMFFLPSFFPILWGG